MSASEKLKALETGRGRDVYPYLLNALPQLVAVVKAAEICRSEWRMGSILATALDALDGSADATCSRSRSPEFGTVLRMQSSEIFNYRADESPPRPIRPVPPKGAQ
jgi:hypothetical protein